MSILKKTAALLMVLSLLLSFLCPAILADDDIIPPSADPIPSDISGGDSGSSDSGSTPGDSGSSDSGYTPGDSGSSDSGYTPGGSTEGDIVTPTVPDTTPAATGTYRENLTIYFTGNIHGNLDSGLSYAKLATIYRNTNNSVLLDVGGSFCGSTAAALKNGSSIASIMNAVGYKAATFSAGDFELGTEQLLSIAASSKFPFLGLNLYTVKNGAREKNALNSYTTYIVSGDLKLAVIGLVAPNADTVHSSAFVSPNGEQLYALSSREEICNQVQTAVDAARVEHANYIVLLTQIGENNSVISVEELIGNTHYIDIVIDGNSSEPLEAALLQNSAGTPVPLTSPGSDFTAVGKLTIDLFDNKTVSFITDMSNVTPANDVEKLEKQLVAELEKQNGQAIAAAGTALVVDDGNGGTIGCSETNLGDIITDAWYWYLNDFENISCDAVLLSAGSIAAGVSKGDVSFNTLKTVLPDSGKLCVISVTGRQLLNALEQGASGAFAAGIKSDSRFLQSAGIRYGIDLSVAAGEDRIFNAEVYDRSTGNYLPLNPDAVYTIAGTVNDLTAADTLYNAFSGSAVLNAGVIDCRSALLNYLSSFTVKDKLPNISSSNSPLSVCSGYLLNYENLSGSGRIKECAHPESSIVEDDSKPTCLGNLIGSTYCSECGKVLKPGTEPPYIPHTPADPVFDWNYDYSSCTASMSCYVCGTVLVEDIPCRISQVVTTEASADADGFMRIYASFDYNGNSFSDSKPMVIHSDNTDSTHGFLKFNEANLYLYISTALALLAFIIVIILLTIKPKRR